MNTRRDPRSSELLYHSIVDSPVGPLTVVISDVGVRALLWPDDGGRVQDVDDAMTDAALDGELPATVQSIAAEVSVQLGEYFAGNRTDFDVPLDPVGSDFQRDAWRALREIPYGETVSYGEQAERMGDRNKARAVGAANGKNPISIIVPCHRVVGSDGSLTGFAGGIETKRFLLDLERRVSGRSLL